MVRKKGGMGVASVGCLAVHTLVKVLHTSEGTTH